MKNPADLDTRAKSASANTPSSAQASPALSISAAIFKDVHVAVEARLGAAEMTIEELLALRAGAVIKLDLKMNETVELTLNNALVARGEIVAVDENFGVRVTEVAQLK